MSLVLYVLLCAGLAFGQSAANLEQLVAGTVDAPAASSTCPGISVAIVKDGKVVLAKGYGARNRTTQAPMTENTLVGIASNTKAFTSAALAMLVDDGKLNWSDRVIDKLPEFPLPPPLRALETQLPRTP